MVVYAKRILKSGLEIGAERPKNRTPGSLVLHPTLIGPGALHFPRGYRRAVLPLSIQIDEHPDFTGHFLADD